MSDAAVLSLGREALMTVLLAVAPMLGLGLLVGLLVSIFQATTQIQEQTLAFIPKILAVLVSVVVFGPWIMQLLVDFSRRLLMNMDRFVG